MPVIDASVAVKWVVSEPLEDEARRYLDRGQLSAPAHLAIEVASAITRKQRMGVLSRGDAQISLSLWYDFLRADQARLVDDASLLRQAASLSLDIGHALKDCLYVALAERHGQELVTADERLADRARMVLANVTLLA